ncbi:ATPase [Caminibacter mediatlanticus]|uniref:ATP synthase subunit b n=1 Tax=Caminibacter mediatlanticus TB-2 TaxID=391592 RepID=A0AAI9AJ32_9BACT|nr:ATPase [Caminibacter mediatlanticus]EDM24427.1 hypothetical protein CMTB2_02888 [Caminibacter mediatlanticus TB-2]
MLDINIGVMAIMAMIFFITMFFLKIWLFDPLVKFMDEREAKLKNEMELISKNTEETKEIEEEIKTILQLARDDARKTIENAKLKAKEEAEKLKAIKVREIEEAKEALREQLEVEKKKILSELLKDKDELKSLIENKLRTVA